MNIIEREMVEVLTKLKNEYGVIEIKAEYENEGSRQDELMRLKDVAGKVNLPIIIKIGGVEAITDIYNAITLGVSGIIAPMAETKFAVSKFVNAVDTFVAEDNREDIEFAFNVETITAYNNIDDILSLENINLLSGVTIGRVDFTASMEKDRNFADSDEMLEYCTKIFQKSRAKGLKCGLGGAISTNSSEFIKSLVSQNLIDKYETRKIVYNKDAIHNISDGILAGVEFELLWLKSKRRYYQRIKSEDEKRIEMLEKRLGQK
ncbi:MAG: aldolase/citrate lyase family protein [Sulfuricurvum sp.]|uniref:aldolase/citrate lyase family protein n=1 Tax=Sulfuricurvum sp. TaxID=2025608 RepID=UPI0026393D29|nr:aldolase/citrate lyase family protein [Sulfuricurvum sp.]MDD2828641.1 aldolase/citrate lyase family protein [Sulfuricurvum sp.]MDD4948318.1 aldolase/citrate lyase family protein [Sulfuricurvum sp.]